MTHEEWDHWSNLCDSCDNKRAVDGFNLCEQCYENRRSIVVPSEDATFEELLEFCEKQNNNKRKRSIYCALPIHKATHADARFKCSICLDNYSIEDSIITTECMHRYHQSCLLKWIQEKRTCPICTTDIN